jgi:glutamate-1-semialdehyde aminotransferase
MSTNVDPRYRESYREFDLAQRLLPGGVTRARIPQVPGRCPVYMSRAEGARIWDVDGHEYIDWMSGYGCILLGHRCKEVDDAAIRAIEQGFISQMPSPIQNDLAEVLIGMIPSAERVRYFKTGSDATTAAVRVARIHTGRDHVIRWGFHGWTDWSVSNFHGFDVGVPQAVRDLTHAMEYNDIASVERLFGQYPGQIACVIMMPFEMEEPKPGFLEGVKDLCHRHGAVLIFDEIRSGFRMPGGSAQAHYGVTPDLTCLSKGMANGYALSAVVGRAEVMDCIPRGLFSATFFVSALEMAASLATLAMVKREPVTAHLWEMGRRFQDGLRQALAGSPLHLEVVGVPPMPFIKFAGPDAVANDRAKLEFYAETARRGVFFHPNHHWFVNYAHSADDVDRSVAACAAARQVAEIAAG